MFTADLINAACLAVTGAMYKHGLCETFPEEPETDENGLYMQLTVPKWGIFKLLSKLSNSNNV